MQSIVEQLGITYSERDGILYPNIQISNEEEDDRTLLGKFGRMAMNYLHERHPQRFTALRMTGELMSKMHKVDEEATEKLETIYQQLMKADPPPQTEDILVKTRHLNSLRASAEEIVLSEIVYKVR